MTTVQGQPRRAQGTKETPQQTLGKKTASGKTAEAKNTGIHSLASDGQGAASTSVGLGAVNVSQGATMMAQMGGGGEAAFNLVMSQMETMGQMGAFKQLTGEFKQVLHGQNPPTPTSMTQAQTAWGNFLGGFDPNAVDVNALVMAVLRESYEDGNRDLEYFARKVDAFNKLKANIRDEISRARDALVEAREAGITTGQLPQEFETQDPTAGLFEEEGGEQGQQGGGGGSGGQEEPENPQTVEQLEALIENLEEQLQTAGEDAQLANVDLQNNLQRQQQMMQMMSNISKMLHDTAMSIIRKIGN